VIQLNPATWIGIISGIFFLIIIRKIPRKNQ